MASNIYKNYSSEGAVNAPALRYPQLAGITAPANVSPDNADAGLVIPIRLTTYSGPTSKQQVNSIDLMPVFNPANGGFAVGGKTVSYGASELIKIQMEGYIDTPCTETIVSGESLNIPKPTLNSMAVTYADLIATYTEGRASISSVNVGGTTINNMWTRVNPTWFRDPFGKVFNNPKVINFSGSYVEAIPARTNFTMLLQVQSYDY